MKDRLRKKYIGTLIALGGAALVFVVMAMISRDFDVAVYSTMMGVIIWLVLDHVELKTNIEILMGHLGITEED